MTIFTNLNYFWNFLTKQFFSQWIFQRLVKENLSQFPPFSFFPRLYPSASAAKLTTQKSQSDSFAARQLAFSLLFYGAFFPCAPPANTRRVKIFQHYSLKTALDSWSALTRFCAQSWNSLEVGPKCWWWCSAFVVGIFSLFIAMSTTTKSAETFSQDRECLCSAINKLFGWLLRFVPFNASRSSNLPCLFDLSLTPMSRWRGKFNFPSEREVLISVFMF